MNVCPDANGALASVSIIQRVKEPERRVAAGNEKQRKESGEKKKIPREIVAQGKLKKERKKEKDTLLVATNSLRVVRIVDEGGWRRYFSFRLIVRKSPPVCVCAMV